MVHTFSRAGLYLALDVGSGSVHMLDALAYDMLRYITEEELRSGSRSSDCSSLVEKYGEKAVEEVFQELVSLTEQKVLYADDSYIEFSDQLGPAPVKALCLHVAHDCNLRCEYCFASTGDFGGNRMLMGEEVAKAAIDLLIELSDKRHNLEVDFFGGEPLMNFDVVKKTVEYARSVENNFDKHFRFTITTNGLALKEDSIQYINREMDNVVLSLDGRKEINDAMRFKLDGTGSYDTIVPAYQKLVAGRGEKEYYVRGTYTRNNLDFYKDVLEIFHLGFDQISVEPVVGPETDAYSIQERDVAATENSYALLMKEIINRKKFKKPDFNFFHFMLDLDNGPCAIKRLKGCGSGNEYLAVTPNGDLYPCHQFVGDEAFLMGNIHQGLTRMDLKEQFAQAHLLNKTECQSCWAKFFCSGGCNANNFSFNGSLLKPHGLSCQLEKIRLECAIAIKAALYQEEMDN